MAKGGKAKKGGLWWKILLIIIIIIAIVLIGGYFMISTPPEFPEQEMAEIEILEAPLSIGPEEQFEVKWMATGFSDTKLHLSLDPVGNYDGGESPYNSIVNSTKTGDEYMVTLNSPTEGAVFMRIFSADGSKWSEEMIVRVEG